MIRAINRRRGFYGDEGVTLVEQIVAMAIFLIVATIVTAAVISMFKSQQRVSAQNDNLNTARKLEETLDYEARYADAITTPGVGTDGKGDIYVEWRQTNSPAEPSECFQWRWVPNTSVIQQRHWLQAFGASPVSKLSSWNTIANGVVKTGSNPIFQLGPYNAVDSQPAAVNQQIQGHQQLTMMFTATHAGRSLANQITITGINSLISPAVPASTCAEEGRS